MMGPGISQTDLSIIRDLGIISEMGGTDGAGIYQVKSHKYSPHTPSYELMYKSWSTWSQVVTNEIDNKQYNDLLSNTFVDVVIGHVRASTKGGISDSNAHPFVFPNLVGVHNGTLKDQKYLHDKEKTDSELMFKDISERGVEAVLTELDRDSAFAIVMYNKIDRKVYFARNELRPLSFAFIEDRAVMYWASEPGMLRFVLDRYGQTYKIFNLKVNTVVKVYTDNISTFKIKDDPLKIFEVHCKLDRQLPTHIQKMRDEMERKKKEEEEKAARILSQSAITCTETTGSTTEGSGAENFPPETQKSLFDIRNSLPKCSCSNYTLTLVQKSMAERGKPGRFTYNHTAETYHCEKCRSLNVIVSTPKEEARVG
jgi:hypothetical protein